MLSAAQVEQFHRDGFLNGGPVLTDAEVEELRAELTRVIEQKGRGDVPQPVLLRNLSGNDKAPVWQVVNIWQASPAFRRIMAKPAITGAIAQLTNARELRIWHDQIQYKPAETGGVNMWHQDSPLWPILKPQTQVTAWIALDDVDTSNGCMSMVPGSHKWGDRMAWLAKVPTFTELPTEFEGRPVQVRLCPVERGHVHFHHGLTWHGSHANTSGRPRRAIAFHYMTQDTWYDATGNHCMKDFVQVQHGEQLTGPVFELVWRA
jgi:ectoine hydroxylase-related dioxygenase (phytanoyl-CoA dioxygenase family)